MYDGAAGHGQVNGGVANLARGYREDVLAQHRNVGPPSGFYRAQKMLVAVDVGHALGEGCERVADRQALVGSERLRSLDGPGPAEVGREHAVDGDVDFLERIGTLDGPV